MPDTANHQLKPGDEINLTTAAEPAKISLDFSDGTKVAFSLGPGAEVKVTLGQMSCNVTILDADAPLGVREIDSKG